jgi:hypothetical protein
MRPGWAQFLFEKIREAGNALAAFSALLETLIPAFFAPFFVAIVAIVATDNFDLPFGFVSIAKAQGTNPNNLAFLGDALHNPAMPVVSMNDVVFLSHSRGRESDESPKRQNRSHEFESSFCVNLNIR